MRLDRRIQDGRRAGRHGVREYAEPHHLRDASSSYPRNHLPSSSCLKPACTSCSRGTFPPHPPEPLRLSAALRPVRCPLDAVYFVARHVQAGEPLDAPLKPGCPRPAPGVQADGRGVLGAPRQAVLRPAHARRVHDIPWPRVPDLAHRRCTMRLLACTAPAISPLVMPPLAFSRTIRRTCDTSSLDATRTREFSLKRRLSPPPPYPRCAGCGYNGRPPPPPPPHTPSFPLRGSRSRPRPTRALPRSPSSPAAAPPVRLMGLPPSPRSKG